VGGRGSGGGGVFWGGWGERQLIEEKLEGWRFDWDGSKQLGEEDDVKNMNLDSLWGRGAAL